MTFRNEKTGRFIYAESIVPQHTPISLQKMLNGEHGPREEFEGFDLDWLSYFPAWLMP